LDYSKKTLTENENKLKKYVKLRTENLLGLRENFKFTETKTTKVIDKLIKEEIATKNLKVKK